MNDLQNLPSAEYIWQELGCKLRSNYWLNRNLTYGQGDNNIWYLLARKLTSKIVPLSLFIDSQFFSSKRLHRPPSPKQLLGKKAFQRYEKYRDSQDGSIEERMSIKLQSLIQIARTNVVHIIKCGRQTTENAVLTTLHDYQDEFPPLFCYSLLTQMENISHKKQVYFLDAVLEYVPLRDEYDEAWGTILPVGFRELALKTYCDLFEPSS